MYESFFGLTARPFDLTADPRFFFETPQHREGLTTLRYGIEARKGLVVLTGEAGTGKTTVVRAVVSEQKQRGTQVVYIANPTLSVAEFYETLAHGFDLGASALGSKAALLSELTAVLMQCDAEGRLAALVVDEAQSLPTALLEEIRLLANTETACAKLLQVVLVGQPEFAGRLNDPALCQLKQRVALRCALSPLGPGQTAAFIAGRIRIAGGHPRSLFSADAVQAIHRYSRGIPRWINVISDNALLTAFATDARPVDGRVVSEVARDLDLETSERPLDLSPLEAERPAAAPELFQHVTARRRPLSFLFG